METPLVQKTFTVRRAQKPSHTFLRYSDDGGKTFTPASSSALLQARIDDGRNMLYDGDFSEKSGFWRKNGSAATFEVIKTGLPDFIETGVKVSCPGQYTGLFYASATTVIFHTGRTYCIGLWAKSAVAGTFIRVQVEGIGGENIKLTAGWAYYEVRVTGDGSDRHNLTFYLAQSTPAEVFMSRVCLCAGVSGAWDKVSESEMKVMGRLVPGVDPKRNLADNTNEWLFKKGTVEKEAVVHGCRGGDKVYLSFDWEVYNIKYTDCGINGKGKKEVGVQFSMNYGYHPYMVLTNKTTDKGHVSQSFNVDKNIYGTSTPIVESVSANLYLHKEAFTLVDDSSFVKISNFMFVKGDEELPYAPSPIGQTLGTTPGKYLGTLVWDKPYPSMDTSAYTWSEVQGRDAVIRHSPNGLWFSNADTGRIEGYNGKWLVITYPYHTDGPVCKELLEGSGTTADGCFQVTDEVMNTIRFAPDGNNREWFSYYAVTYAYFTEATTVDYTARTDDQSALYVNDKLLYNIETCTDTPVSINFDKGWNKVEFILEEGVSEQYTHLDPWLSKSTNCLGIDCSQAGTIPADYLGTLSGDGVLDFMKYSWAKVRGKDGRPGFDAVSVLLSTELITVDTDDNGAVPPEALNDAYADVKAYRGNKPTTVTANVIGTSAPGIGAMAEADRIKITSIGVDPSTGYAYGSGYVDIEAIVAGTRYPLRLFVGTNLHKITSKWVQDTKNFRSELGELRKDYNGKKTQWDTAIRQNKEAIGLKVGKTEFDANNNMVSAQISQIKVESDSIRLSVEAIKGGARNLLVGSGFRKRDEVPWNGSDTYCSIVKSNGYKGSNAVYVNSTATALAFAGVCFPKVPVKPSTRYSLSVMAMSPDISSFTAAASVEIREYTSDTEFTRIAAPSLIPDKNGVYKTVKTAFTTRPDTRHLSVFFYVVKAGRLYICRPMLEEGEYKGWSLSENDFDYTGGNLLDGSRLLDGSNLVVKNGTVIEHGYGEFSAIHCDNTSGSSYVDVLQWSNDNNALGLKANTDYMLSMWVKGNGLFQSFLYGTEHATVYAEGSDGMSNSVSDGYTSAALTDTWKKVWVHWRTGSTVPRYILPVRLHKGNSATVAGVKLEEGATVTEYTESRTDMVSKQALLATGIDITNRKVVVTGDNVVLQNTQGNVTAQLNKDGKLNTELIEATKVVTEGIKAKEIDAEFARFKNMIVEGAVSSPYTTVGSGFDLTRHDNAWLGGNNEWVNNFNLKWDVSQRGRTLHLSNYGTSLPTTGVGKINAPSGKWFFDNGRKFSQLLVYPGTVVVLHGLGDENTFHGWLVEQRHDPSHNKTGVPFRVFAWGFATCSKTGDADFENYRTFDGSRLGISRMDAGWCRITMPYAWYSILQTYGSHWYHHFGVIATGYGYSEDGANEFCPIKASVKSMGLNGNTPYVDIWLSDDDTANDGRFQFIFYNMDFNDGFQTSDNR